MVNTILFCVIYAFIGYVTRLIIAYRLGFKDDIYNDGIDYLGGAIWPIAIIFTLVYYAFVGVVYVFSRRPLRRIHIFFVQHIGGRKIDV